MLELNAQICHSLYSATNALVRAYRPLLEPLGLTYPQYLIMLSLWQRDGVSVKQLSEHTRLDSGTLTPILKRLEAQGLLTREHATDDERQKRLVLTAAGRKLKAAAKKVPTQLVASLPMKLGDAKQLKLLCEELYGLLCAQK